MKSAPREGFARVRLGKDACCVLRAPFSCHNARSAATIALTAAAKKRSMAASGA